LSWEKKNVDESSGKRSILTTFVGTKDQKRPKLTSNNAFDLF
jgi:hypothetical protein